MSARLTVEVEQEPSKDFPLGQVFTIGRGPGNDLIINDARASRNHAVVRLQDKIYYLLDFGSSNGTLLNGRRVMIPSALKTGDEIIIANHRLIFEHEGSDQQAGENLTADDMRTQVELTSVTVSILVVDIRNYTGLTEAIPDVDLSRIIGKWFQEANIVIEKNGGTVHKYIGDAIMAYWEKARTPGDPTFATGPIQSAVDLIHLAKLFHQQLSSTFADHSFHIGCGINAGRALSGKVGSSKDFIGDCVNVAFRLESLCKELQRSIIISEDVKVAAEKLFKCEDLGLQKVKGKSKDLRVYGVAC
jgi:adenylate cyclase